MLEKIKLANIIDFLFFILFIIAPFISFLAFRFPFISAVKEVTQVTIIVSLLLLIVKSGRIYKWGAVLALAFIYISFHFYNLLSSSLILDGARYQLGYMLIALLLYNARHMYTINVTSLIKIITIQVFMFAIVGVVEFFDERVITLFYGIEKQLIGNNQLAVGSRLISLALNPINFGVLCCLGLITLNYMNETNKVNKQMFFLLISLYFFCCALTLSRLSIICFLLVFLLLLFNRFNYFKNYFIFFILVISVIFTIYIDEILYSFGFFLDRVSGLSSLSAFTENSRIEHWKVAINTLNNQGVILFGLGVGSSNPTLSMGGILVENTLISFMIDFGVIGLLLLVMIILFSLVRLKKNITVYRISIPENKFIFFSILSMLFMSLGNDLHRNFPFSLYFWMFLYFPFSFYQKRTL
jgi:hypothetical protein